jgi:Cys-tRNA(Pro)/Cys-tRNA(Cys) deacylase
MSLRTRDLYATIVAQLEQADAVFTIHEHAPSITIQDADANLWFPVERLMKTIAFRLKPQGWVLAALCGYSQVDYKKLAAICGVSRDKLNRLTPEQVEQDLGYEVGGVSPFAPNDLTRIVIDSSALVFSTIYCGTGRRDRTLEIAPADLVSVTRATVAELRKNG